MMKYFLLFLISHTYFANAEYERVGLNKRWCDIRDFGAVATYQQPDITVADTNAAAIKEAFKNANLGLCGLYSRTVNVPKVLPFYFTSIFAFVRYEEHKFSIGWKADCSFQNIHLAKGIVWKC
mmetsp:Transcript_16519/g.22604  ORF Transcript_16519/g.22604 Transcript_16519/m.22604 type:complete len:123 (-) Transcript_16519:921-1289(-)